MNSTVFTFLLAIFAIPVGIYFSEFAESIEFVGSVFILLLKMIIIPFVACSVFMAIVNIEKETLKKLGSVTLLYYLVTSACACLVGLVLANTLGLGDVIIENSALASDVKISSVSFGSLILSFFPQNILSSFAEGNIIHVILISILFALTSFSLKEASRLALIKPIEALGEAVSIILDWIIRYVAPVGIFSLVASLMTKIEANMFVKFQSVFLVIFLAIIFHVMITIPVISLFVGKFNAFKLYYKIKKVLLVALTTASSSATLPLSIEVARNELDVKKESAEFVLPLGATINMDGSALYQGIVVIFLANLAGIQLELAQQILVLFIVMVSAIGTAGIPSGGLVMIGAVMSSVGIPLEYIGVYLLIDRFWDYPITMINVLGDLCGVKTLDRLIK